ncbi:hypothetical protein J7T55_014671 [Diaporthe amygdali]|uniref:uncharacterized protein n=1 Tax=Phomopsis amygdali TaxID=1214568 RepID=UPI0022FF26F9|nr:uncharacterized protein J7T55_014671 [Diaporthe amygdali]KAJ0107141.1 hypothetical protein J7T55_014671 [Diaporthe amygdali]
MSSNSSKWRKALLPALGNRGRVHDPTNRLPASRTASDISVTVAILQHDDGPPPGSIDDEVDERIISDLLETTDEIENENQSADTRKTKGLAHSQTVGLMPCTEISSVAGSPVKAHNKVTKHATPPRISSKRNLQTVTRDFSRSSPKRSPDDMVRPLPKFRSSNLLGRETRRVAQSPSLSPGKLQAHCRGKTTVRKSGTYVDKTNSPLASVLAVSDDLYGSVADSADFAAPAKMSRLKKNKVFAKFASALSEHFGRQGIRKEEKTRDGATRLLSVSSNEVIKPIKDGLPLGGLTLARLPLPDLEASSTSTNCHSNEDCISEMQKGSTAAEKPPTELSMPQKRLTMVEGSPHLEDPFSEESPKQYSTEFEACLKTVKTVEGIMDTSDNSILKTPPTGCSTPRVRSQDSNSIQFPSKGTQIVADSATETVVVSSGGPATSPWKQRKFAIIRDSPTKPGTSNGVDQKQIGSGSPTKSIGSSDTTRLSSFPPGSTIRHVPRSMGRLAGAPDLSMSAAARRKSPRVGRKKHPSPSKGDLDLYGKFMEESIGLGVFKDTDELAMSPISTSTTNSGALTPRDKNNRLQGSAGRNTDFCKDHNHDSGSGMVARSRSRIPQPVSQRARSRAEKAFARDFLPVNHGDSTTEDELQWNSSAYIVGRGRGSRCDRCGSVSEGL